MMHTPDPNSDRLSETLTHELNLHDRTIQSLFGLGLRLEECLHLIEDSPPQAKEGLDRALNSLNAIISELRGRIDELARRGPGQPG